jgi:hypothetical protein
MVLMLLPVTPYFGTKYWLIDFKYKGVWQLVIKYAPTVHANLFLPF